MKAIDLKNSILQLAISGRLYPGQRYSQPQAYCMSGFKLKRIS